MIANLEDLSWLPVLRGGAATRVSLRTALTEAREIDDLDWADPQAASAALALLVVIARRAQGIEGERVVVELLRVGHFDDDRIESYLDRWRDRFDLLDETRPFYQAAGLEPLSGNPSAVSLLVPSVATGNNVPLFSSVTEATIPPLSLAEAACAVLVIQGWDTAANKTGAVGDPRASAGKTTGNPTGPLGQLGHVAVIGRSLFETIVLNTPWAASSPDDLPVWERPEAPGPAWSERSPSGVNDVLTWQSRRIRLRTADRDGQPVVVGVTVAAGDRIRHLSPEHEFRTAWRRVDRPRPGDPPLRPTRHRSGISAWRSLGALVAGSTNGESTVPPGVVDQLETLLNRGILDHSARVALQLTGVEYGNNSAVVEHVMTDRTPLPLMALDVERGDRVRVLLEETAEQAEGVGRALNELEGNLRMAAGGGKIPWDKGQRVGDRFVAGLGLPAERMLRGLSQAADRAEDAAVVWERVLRQGAWAVAEPMLDGAEPQTFLGRVAGAVPSRQQTAPLRQQTAEAFLRAALNKVLWRTKPEPTTSRPGEPQREEIA